VLFIDVSILVLPEAIHNEHATPSKPKDHGKMVDKIICRVGVAWSIARSPHF